MYQATTLAGTGGHYVRLTALRHHSGPWSSTPSAIVSCYGAEAEERAVSRAGGS